MRENLIAQSTRELTASKNPSAAGEATGDVGDAAAARRSIRWLASRRASVAVVGPDGVGKSAAIACAKQWLEREIPGIHIEIRKWRPGLLPDLGWFLGKSASEITIEPRRTPGRFHLPRLCYYFVDFTLGLWWRDVWRTRPQTLIIYDRCALDMYVDPARYGLQSSRWTRLLWRMIPKPNLLILLYDSPERIWERKGELQQQEIAIQLEAWLKLAEEGHVHAIVRVDAEPNEISFRMTELMLDMLVRRHSAKSVLADTSPDTHASVREILAGTQAAPSLGTSREGSFSETTARLAPIPHSHRRVGPVKRTARSFLRRLGSPRIGCEGRQRWRSDLLEEYFRTVFGCNDISIKAAFDLPDIRRNAVIQLLLEGKGQSLGYAKIGWSPVTVRLVQNEEAVLKKLRSVRFSTATVPRVIHAGWRDNLYVIIQDQAAGLVRDRISLDERHIRFLLELHTALPSSRQHCWAACSLEVEEELEALKRAGFPYYAHVLRWALAYCREHLQAVILPCGLGHGSFNSGNIRIESGQLVVLNWEYADSTSPPGRDLFCFLLANAIESQGNSAPRILRDIMHPGRTRTQIQQYFEQLSVPEGLIEPLFIAYIAEVLQRSLDVSHGNSAVRDEQLCRTLSLLLMIARNRLPRTRGSP